MEMQDIIISGGLIADGSGAEPYPGGVAVRDGLITRVGDVSGLHARQTLDAAGLVIAPGFIDAHCHSDVSFIMDKRSQSRIFQGVTTEVCGQCGDSYFPCLPEKRELISSRAELPREEEWAAESFEAFRSHVIRRGIQMSTNLCQLVGHGALRSGVMGKADRAPDASELYTMCRLLERDLAGGAWGLSLGLEYSPGCFSGTDELAALACVVKRHGGIVTVHMRDEGQAIFDAVGEVIEIGRRSGARMHISHLKIDRPVNWGRAREVWELIESARREGIALTADVYPYTASCTGITNRCPKWAIEGGVQSAARFLRSERRGEILAHLAGRFPDAEWARRCLISNTYSRFPEAEGKTLLELSEMLRVSYAEAAAELIERTDGLADCIFFSIDERDLDYFIRRDVCIGSDGKGYPLDPALVGSEKPHPRYYGAIVRFLRLAREQSLCPVGKAVRRVTADAADMLGLADRGRLVPGLAADITVFDAAGVSDKATYLDPFRRPDGIVHVVVNGHTALCGGVETQACAGEYILSR